MVNSFQKIEINFFLRKFVVLKGWISYTATWKVASLVLVFRWEAVVRQFVHVHSPLMGTRSRLFNEFYNVQATLLHVLNMWNVLVFSLLFSYIVGKVE